MALVGFFQVFGRTNDTNGNPYRLVAIYDEKAQLVRLVQERCSRPNTVGQLVHQGFVQLPDVFLSATEYNSWVKGFKRILEHA